MAERMDTSRRIIRWLVEIGEDNARGSYRARDIPGRDDAVADGARRLIAAATNYRSALCQTGRLCGRSRDAPSYIA